MVKPEGCGIKIEMSTIKLRGQLQIKIEIIFPRIWGFFETKAHRQKRDPDGCLGFSN
jgi:hypothetical protein